MLSLAKGIQSQRFRLGLNLCFVDLKLRLPPCRSTQPVPAQPYVVRVLVPCYTESLEIVQKTVLAAANADLPPLACRTVYLLDDGKDVSKAAWVAEQVHITSAFLQ